MKREATDLAASLDFLGLVVEHSIPPAPRPEYCRCRHPGCRHPQLTSSENWRLNLAATVQPSRLLPLAAFSISAVATFRVPRPSGDGYNAGGYIALWLTPQSRLAG